MKRYLITGAPGWLGNRFVAALAGQIEELKELAGKIGVTELRALVHPAFDASPLKKIYPDIHIVPGDITQRDSLKDFFAGAEGTVLIHMAGLVHATQGTKQFFEVNVQGTKNLLEYSVQNKVKRIVAVSSNSPAGLNPVHDHVFDESAPFHPYMSYGRSKMQMEELVQAVTRKGEMESVILRPCWYYGPGQPPRQTLFFSMIRQGKVPIVGSGENKRSMSYVDHVCQALLLAAQSEKANGETYWIVDKKPYSMNEVVNTVERLLEKEFKMTVAHKRMRLPAAASDMARVVDGTLQACGLYQQKIHVLSELGKTIAATSAKAEKELGYRPTIELEEGMRRSIRWCLEQGHAI